MALSRRNIHIIQVLLLLLLIGLTVVILWPFQKALDRSMLEFPASADRISGRKNRQEHYLQQYFPGGIPAPGKYGI